MENLNALADIANTKAADAAKSPMPPPPATPGTSGKKRKRSAAAIARDKLVTSKKCQTYKLYEVLQHHRVIKDPKDAGDLEKYCMEMAILARDGDQRQHRPQQHSNGKAYKLFNKSCDNIYMLVLPHYR